MATNSAPSPLVAHARPSLDQMHKGRARIIRVIGDVERFDTNAVTARYGPGQLALELLIKKALESVFGTNTFEYGLYKKATTLDNGPISAAFGYISAEETMTRVRQYLAQGKDQSVYLLMQAVRWLDEEIADAVPSVTSQQTIATQKSNIMVRKIFIVHGHDVSAKERVARFVERIDFEAIILSEQASQGRTIIEQIEKHGDVGFAIVLMTPDDVGSKVGGSSRPRPRQNVLVELGYFIGRLTRNNVCTLVSAAPDFELPTDFSGTIWHELDSAGAWKADLLRELMAAGFEIDWNKAMK